MTTQLTEYCDIIQQAKDHFQQATNAWSEYRSKSQEILAFYSGEQWDERLKMNRQNAGLPALQFNQLKKFKSQITNTIRKNTPSIQFNPADDDASESAAEVLSDLTRTIQNESAADTAYDIAVDCAAEIGMGFIRVVSEYVSDDSFDQRLVIKAVEDAHSVLIDPTHRDFAGDDIEFAFVLSTMSKDTYLRQYKDSQMANSVTLVGWTADGVWVTESEVMIAEYYYKQYETKTLHLVYNTITQQTENTFIPDKQGLSDGTLISLKKRDVLVPTIKWVKINDCEVLEQTDWPGTRIPIVPVKCTEKWVSGRRVLQGMIEDAIDAQKAYNYFLSLQAELVQLAPKAPFIGEVRQFANFEQEWANANVSPSAVLRYNAISLEGQPLPVPARQSSEVPIQAAASLTQQASQSLQAVFGIYDPALGATSNETSGKAILAREDQSYNANYHLGDNLNRAIVQLGKIMLEALPTFYDTARLVQLTNEAGEARPLQLNSSQQNSIDQYTKGRYNVSVSAGASYTSRRQEAVKSILALGTTYPAAMPVISDILVENMDWPGHKRIAARLKAVVPPEVLASADSSDKEVPQQVVAQLKQQLEQQGQALEAINAHSQQVEQELITTKDQLKLTKLDRSVELKKAELDYNVDLRRLALEEERIELEVGIEMKKLALEDRKLAVHEAGMGIKATVVASQLNAAGHDRTMEHIKAGTFNQPKQLPDLTDASNSSDNDTNLGGDLGINGI